MPMLAELVDVVIDFDSHKHTHTEAVVSASTGGALERHTVPADADGYAALLELGQAHAGLRAWALEGTKSYGAGPSRVLLEAGEWVIELDRPVWMARPGGAKSDPLDAVRAAREALGRDHLAVPRAGGERQALSVLLVTRRSAVEAARVATCELHALVVTAPSHCGSASAPRRRSKR